VWLIAGTNGQLSFRSFPRLSPSAQDGRLVDALALRRNRGISALNVVKSGLWKL
jgi:hypothetical protein